MSNANSHPGIHLNKVMLERNLTQRELASKIDIAHSLLNAIINGNRNINVAIALSLEAAGFDKASFWLEAQVKYSLVQAKNDKDLMKKNDSIKTLDELDGDWIPLSFFRKYANLGADSPEALQQICNIYGAKNPNSLKKKIEQYPLAFFRKSAKLKESRVNVIAWTVLAEHLALEQEVPKFDSSKEKQLISELKECFYKNKDTLNKTKKILNKYGIKFFILDRPNKTPVDGKSFMSGKNPAIVLTLKYKRLDNFAFTLMHELGHVFRHLTKAKYKSTNFFVNNSDLTLEEYEADDYARNTLISLDTWDDFVYRNTSYSDEVIMRFSKSIKVHPAIIRGRVCFENNEYYRRRTRINIQNVLS